MPGSARERQSQLVNRQCNQGSQPTHQLGFGQALSGEADCSTAIFREAYEFLSLWIKGDLQRLEGESLAPALPHQALQPAWSAIHPFATRYWPICRFTLYPPPLSPLPPIALSQHA
jgi:hypothetical protein